MKTAFSMKKTPEEVTADLKSQLGDKNPQAVLFFASSVYEPAILSEKMQKAFDGAEVFGCTTAGEIVSGKMLKQSVVAMAFEDSVMDQMKLSVIENVNQAGAVEQAFSGFEKYFGSSMSDLDPAKHVGIILVDGLSKSEEKLIDRIGDLTNITFIGGSAGDDLQFKATHVFANGKAYTNAAVLALLKPKVGFDIIKTQSFCALDREFTATKVKEADREVIEFNGKPAAVAYAEAIGAAVGDAPKHFMTHPVGLMIQGEPYVRSPQQIKDEGMVFYCNVKEQMKLSILKSTDIVEDTRKAVEAKKSEIGNIDGIVNFHCILRTLELEDKGQTDAYGKIFSDIPTIGFSTYGEQYIGHINQTSTMLVFKNG